MQSTKQLNQSKPRVSLTNLQKPGNKSLQNVTNINITQVNKKGSNMELLKVPQEQTEKKKRAQSSFSSAKTSATSNSQNKLIVQKQTGQKTAVQGTRNASVNAQAQAPKIVAQNKQMRATSINPTNMKQGTYNNTKLQKQVKLFDIQTETNEDGQNQIKLFQPIPQKLEYLIEDMAWIKQVVTKHFQLLKMKDQVKTVTMGKKLHEGIGGIVQLMNLTMQSGSKQTYVLKGNSWNLKELDSFREGIFYSKNMPEMRRRVQEELNIDIEIPKSHFTVVDLQIGRYVNCMEYFENSVPLSDVFNSMNQFVATWEKLGLDSKVDLDEWSYDVVQKIAQSLANMHGAHFLDHETRQKGADYLKAAKWFDAKWYDEQTKQDWQKQMKVIQDTFKQIQLQFKNPQDYPQSFTLLESSIKKINWQNQLQMIQNQDFMWTSVHGQFWPNSTIYSKSTKEICIIDFEDVGFWNPTIDLVVYMLQWPLDFRRKFEKTFLETYHARLLNFSSVPKSYTYDKFMEDFKTHGVGRTVWWMIHSWKISNIGGFKHSLTVIEHFLNDYQVDIQKVPMPSYGMY